MANDSGGPDEPVRPYGSLALFTLVFVPFSTGYFLSFLYRSINAVIAPDLVQDLGLTSSGLGLLTAAFFLGFAVMQLPLGVMLDRYGAARVQSVLLLIAALGAFLFAVAERPMTLILARAIIGLGCAGGLMAAFKAILRWFPARHLALVNGCYLAVGGLGAIAATAPAEAALQLTDWRGLFLGLAAMTVVSALCIFFLSPRGDGAANPSALRTQLAEMVNVFRDRLFWRVAPLSIFGMGGTLSIQGLWAGPWMTDVASLPRDEVAARLFAMNAAMTVGFVATGWVSDALRSRGIATIHLMALGTLVSLIPLAALSAGLDVVGWWHWIVVGVAGNIMALVYPLLSRHFGPALAGRANTANSLLVFVGTFALQYAMGRIVDFWPRAPDGSYPAVSYQVAFGMVFAGVVLSMVWMLRPGADKAASIEKTL